MPIDMEVKSASVNNLYKEVLKRADKLERCLYRKPLNRRGQIKVPDRASELISLAGTYPTIVQ